MEWIFFIGLFYRGSRLEKDLVFFLICPFPLPIEGFVCLNKFGQAGCFWSGLAGSRFCVRRSCWTWTKYCGLRVWTFELRRKETLGWDCGFEPVKWKRTCI